MKHNLQVTCLLVLFFVFAQVVGLSIVSFYIDMEQSAETGETVLNEELYPIEPPHVENESGSFVLIFGMIIIGTLLVLLLVRLKQRKVWKVWYFLSVLVALVFALIPVVRYTLGKISPILLEMATEVALVLAILLGLWKIMRPNMVIHNVTEIVIYGGIAAIIVPIINVTSAVFLLLLISAYDMFAVWKSKHMVSMANFQSSTNVFAGLSIPYTLKKGSKKMPKVPLPPHKKTTAAAKTAILGGGDLAFPLFFSGALMKHTGSFGVPFVVTLGAALGLFFLLYIAEKDKFYPAMPFISGGIFLGWFVTFLF